MIRGPKAGGERRLEIDPDVRRARTPPRDLYFDPAWFEQQRERVFARTWQFASQEHGLEATGRVRPFVYMPGCLDEPLLLARDTHGVLRCMSNVCTHRGNAIVEGEWEVPFLRCRYHGRRFHLDGTFAYMPCFEGVENFPSERDYLQNVPIAAWRGLVFCSLTPAVPANDVVAEVERRVGMLPVTDWKFDSAWGRDYEFDANWALYLENYLEGFHIPFIHDGLTEKLDVKNYRYENFAHGTLQVGIASANEPAFDLPKGHPDFGQRIGAYYFWLFPTTLLNIYPWGLSLNVLQPLSPTRTRVRFLRFVTDASKLDSGAGSSLHQVEMEDEAVVVNCQKGMASRLYRGGRYSPVHETGTHHFHRLLANWMAGGTGL
jgi:choline monooxygenase